MQNGLKYKTWNVASTINVGKKADKMSIDNGVTNSRPSKKVRYVSTAFLSQ
jgi:hypothetical protein